MPKINEIFDVNLLARMLSEGYVKRNYHPKLSLAILNYTDECQHGKQWNEVTKACRGLIYNLETEDIVARPFPKFFNSSELGPSKMGQAFGSNVQVTDKMDGSLGILYPDISNPSGWSIATRGSFSSDQAIKATEIIGNYLGNGFTPSVYGTHLFEIIYPDNRIVLDYGSMEDLVLLATVDIESGYIAGPDSWMVWPGPRAKVFPVSSFKEVKDLPVRDNAEGFVLRNEKTGFMAKVKYDEYVRIHRLIFGMNEKRVYLHLRSGRDIGELFKSVPEEFWPWIRERCEFFLDQYCVINNKARSDFRKAPTDCTRKEFATWAVQQEYPGLLFTLFDCRDITEQIWRMIDYDGRNKMKADQTEDVA